MKTGVVSGMATNEKKSSSPTSSLPPDPYMPASD